MSSGSALHLRAIATHLYVSSENLGKKRRKTFSLENSTSLGLKCDYNSSFSMLLSGVLILNSRGSEVWGSTVLVVIGDSYETETLPFLCV